MNVCTASFRRGSLDLDSSEQETFRAIRDVLERRQIYLQSKGIKNLGHKMEEDQRAEFCKEVREVREPGGLAKKAGE